MFGVIECSKPHDIVAYIIAKLAQRIFSYVPGYCCLGRSRRLHMLGRSLLDQAVHFLSNFVRSLFDTDAGKVVCYPAG